MSPTFATLLMTRPHVASQAFVDSLGASVDKVDVVISPLLEIVPTGAKLDIGAYQGVIFTSSNGVAHGGDGTGKRAYCVGQSTASVAQQRGWDTTLAGRTAEELIETLIQNPPKAPLLHIGGVHKRGNVAAKLTRSGIETDQVDVYNQQSRAMSSDARKTLIGGKPVIVPLFSPRTASQFASKWEGRAPLHLLGLSDAVLKEVENLPAITRGIADSPDADAMRIAVRNLLRRVETRDAPK